MRKLHAVVFPIKYSERFYADILKPEVEEFCKLGASRPPAPLDMRVGAGA